MSDPLGCFDGERQGYQEEPRYEIYEEVLYAMAPPTGDHQILQQEIARQLIDYFRGKRCQPFQAPFGVILTDYIASKKKTEVQPDISVVCDWLKYDFKRGVYRGVPSLIVEVGSPSTVDIDLGYKKDLYEEVGVTEYLVVLDRTAVIRFSLENGLYHKTKYTVGESADLKFTIPSFPGLDLAIRDDWFWFEQESS